MTTEFRFGKQSATNLTDVHPRLRVVAYRALQRTPYDFAVTHGWRGEEVQNALYASGASEVQWPKSKHNKTSDPQMRHIAQLSDAIDFAPYINGQVPWGEIPIFACIAGCFFAAANELGVRLRWGGDWDGDGNTREHKLQDWGHVEIVHD